MGGDSPGRPATAASAGGRARPRGWSMSSAMSRRESTAWIIVLAQSVALFALMTAMSLRGRISPLTLRDGDGDDGKLRHVWHGGVPGSSPGGTCWCGSADGYCMCTPSLAIDVVLASGPDHVWLVERKDTGQYAVMGGFVKVGETTAAAAARELLEETGVSLPFPSPPSGNTGGAAEGKINPTPAPPLLTLLGVYSDPRRDKRRHTASVGYVMEIPPEIGAGEMHPSDDVRGVRRFSLDEALKLDLFSDHVAILTDYRRLLRRGRGGKGGEEEKSDGVVEKEEEGDDGEAIAFVRSVCDSI